MPNMLLTVPELTSQTVPVAIPPNIHPVPGPAFPVPWVVQQALYELFVPERGRVVQCRL